jgi:cytochrome c peroxidase
MIGGPPNLPVEVQQTLEQALLAALHDPGFADWLEATGNAVSPAGSSDTEAAVHAMAQFYENFKQFLE